MSKITNVTHDIGAQWKRTVTNGAEAPYDPSSWGYAPCFVASRNEDSRRWKKESDLHKDLLTIR